MASDVFNNDFEINDEVGEASDLFPQAQMEMIPIRDLVVDPRYQRPLDERKVRTIARHFDRVAFGALLVSRRDGKNYVYDGQHRKEGVLLKTGNPDTLVPCLVVEYDPETEAKAFVLIQTRRGVPTAVHRFRAQLFSGDKTAETIDRIVESVGYQVFKAGGAGADGKLHCVTALERVYGKYGANGLNQTLRIIRNAWDMDHDALSASVIQGVAHFLGIYGTFLDYRRLERRLAETSALTILQRADVMRQSFRIDKPRAISRALVDIYNKGLKGHRLPDWDKVESDR